MCYCPICDNYCVSGVIISGQPPCEFWNDKEGDCRIRKWLELQQRKLELEIDILNKTRKP